MLEKPTQESMALTQSPDYTNLSQALGVFSEVTAALRKRGQSPAGTEMPAGNDALETMAEWYQALPDVLGALAVEGERVPEHLQDAALRHSYWAGNYLQRQNFPRMSILGMVMTEHGAADQVRQIAIGLEFEWAVRSAP